MNAGPLAEFNHPQLPGNNQPFSIMQPISRYEFIIYLPGREYSPAETKHCKHYFQCAAYLKQAAHFYFYDIL